MEVFINEKSLHSQYNSNGELEAAILEMLSMLKTLNLLNEKLVFTDHGALMTTFVIKDANFHSSLKTINKEIKRHFSNLIYGKSNILDWRQDQKHSLDDIFEHEEEIVTNTSLAEVCERKITNRDRHFMLINFGSSKYSGKDEIHIQKNQAEKITTPCICLETKLGYWISRNFPKLIPYDINSKRPPRDFETILLNSTLFCLVPNLKNQGRKVYKQLSTGHFWTVDNASFGRNAQIEVFNSSDGTHIGIASINSIDIDLTKARAGRNIEY